MMKCYNSFNAWKNGFVYQKKKKNGKKGKKKKRKKVDKKGKDGKKRQINMTRRDAPFLFL